MSSSAPVRVSRVGGKVLTFSSPKTLWKKAHLSDRECLVKMELLVGRRLVYPARPAHSWNGNKLRAERVRVVDLEELDGGSANEIVAIAPHVRSFRYRVGEMAIPSDFDPDTTTTDAAGIHCYATRQGARYWGRKKYEDKGYER